VEFGILFAVTANERFAFLAVIGFPQQFARYPFILLGGERNCEG